MKKVLIFIMAAVMMLSLAACSTTPTEENGSEVDTQADVQADVEETSEAAVSGDSVAQTLVADFKAIVAADASLDAQAIADKLLTNPVIQFGGAAVPVEAGFLTGFDNVEITGFESGVMFAPMIGTIPFVGYVFTLADGADVAAFVKTLEDNANLRWNICTEADEMVAHAEGNTVFFVMSPVSFEA